MPYKRKRTYRRKKRTYTRRGKGYQVSKSIRAPMPTAFKTKFLYAEQVVVDPGAGTVAEHVFSANGLFDPNTTGVGHQPRGFDQFLGIMYDHYTVIGCRLTCSFSNSGSATPVMVFLKLTDNTTTSVNPIDFLESSYCKRTTCAGNGGSPTTMAINVSPAKFLGRKAMDNDLRGSVSTNPSEMCYIHIGACAVDGITDPSGIGCTVQIEYIVLLTEPKLLTSS